jgi:hypothetical protein
MLVTLKRDTSSERSPETMKSILLVLSLTMLFVLSGCSLSPLAITSSTGEASSPVVEESVAVVEMENRVAMIVEDVGVEIGVGSPIAILVNIAGTWPTLCAQLAGITVEQVANNFEISLLTDPGPPDCPPDHLGLPFGITIPLNGVEMADGHYTVSAHGLSAGFDVPLVPAVPVDPGTGAPVEEIPGPVSGTFCPLVSAPVVALFLPGEGYLITNPLTGTSCRTALDGEVPGRFTATTSGVFYHVEQGTDLVLKHLAYDGMASLLPFTATARDGLFYPAYAISADGQRVAWSHGSVATTGADGRNEIRSDLFVANVDGSGMDAPLLGLDTQTFADRAVVPVRFSADNRTLFYTLQPLYGDGPWNSFTGRYDNLYALPLDGNTVDASQIQPLFDCADHGLFLCLGDFAESEGQLTALAYVDANNALVIHNGAGTNLNVIALDADYVGFPTFGPGGELVFYSAEFGPDPLRPAPGTIYRVAPPTAPHEIVASAEGLLMPQAWLDATHVVAGYSGQPDVWGTAIVGLDGSLQVLQEEPNASFIAVIPVP